MKALFNRSTIYISPLPDGAPWRCRLGCELDILQLLLLRSHAGTSGVARGAEIDKVEQDLIKKEAKKWQEILTRLLDIIMFLAKQNLALLGSSGR